MKFKKNFNLIPHEFFTFLIFDFYYFYYYLFFLNDFKIYFFTISSVLGFVFFLSIFVLFFIAILLPINFLTISSFNI